MVYGGKNRRPGAIKNTHKKGRRSKEGRGGRKTRGQTGEHREERIALENGFSWGGEREKGEAMNSKPCCQKEGRN